MIALVASAATYVTSSAANAWKEYTWKDDVEVAYFTSTESSLIANTGSGDVFVSQIEVYFGGSIVFFINKHLEKGKFASVETKNESKGDDWKFVAAPTGQTVSTEEYLPSANRKCVIDVFMSASFPFFARLREHYKPRNLVVTDVTAVIHFVSGRSGKPMNKSFPLHWLLVKDNASEC